MDGVPVVAVTGQVARAGIGTFAFQETDILGVTIPVTKHGFLVQEVSDIPEVFSEAFRFAASGRPGPVLVDIPKDVQAALVDEKTLSLSGRKSPELGGPPQSTQEIEPAIRQVAKLLSEAERPVLLVGRGVVLSGTAGELSYLAEHNDLPVVTSLLGLDAFPASDPRALGMPGMHGTERANYSLQDADLVLGLGVRFDDRVIGRPDSFAPNARIVHFDVDPTAIERTMRADVAVVADLSESLKMLLPLVPKADRKVWWERIREWNREADPTQEPPRPGYRRMGPLGAREAIRSVARKISESNAIAVSDVGQHQMWLAQELGDAVPGSHLTSGGLGAMGYALPAGLGAAIGQPDRPVWVVAGDGGFQMSLQELATVVQEGIPLRIVVIDNGYLGMVRQWQERFYGKRYSETQISGPDLVTLGKAYGIPTWRIDRSEQLDSTLSIAATEEGPVLIWMQVRQEENVYPMVPSGAALDEMVTEPKRVPG
jgi:acetolactate synthase-1/2/3 large subunit